MLKVNEQAIELQHLQRTHILQLFFSLFKREEVFRVNIGAHRAHRFTLIATWSERRHLARWCAGNGKRKCLTVEWQEKLTSRNMTFSSLHSTLRHIHSHCNNCHAAMQMRAKTFRLFVLIFFMFVFKWCCCCCCNRLFVVTHSFAHEYS